MQMIIKNWMEEEHEQHYCESASSIRMECLRMLYTMHVFSEFFKLLPSKIKKKGFNIFLESH